jgi:hypothetical protein
VPGTVDLLSLLPGPNHSSGTQGPGAGGLTVEPAAGVSLSAALVAMGFVQTAGPSGRTIANAGDGGIENGGTLTVSG